MKFLNLFIVWPPRRLFINKKNKDPPLLTPSLFICQQEKQRPPPPPFSPNLYICQHEKQGPTFDPHSVYFLTGKTKTLLPILERSTVTLCNSRGFSGISFQSTKVWTFIRLFKKVFDGNSCNFGSRKRLCKDAPLPTIWRKSVWNRYQEEVYEIK